MLNFSSVSTFKVYWICFGDRSTLILKGAKAGITNRFHLGYQIWLLGGVCLGHTQQGRVLWLAVFAIGWAVDFLALMPHIHLVSIGYLLHVSTGLDAITQTKISALKCLHSNNKTQTINISKIFHFLRTNDQDSSRNK